MSGLIAMPGISWGTPLLTASTLAQLHDAVLAHVMEDRPEGGRTPWGQGGWSPWGWGGGGDSLVHPSHESKERRAYLRALSAEAVAVFGFEWRPGMRAMLPGTLGASYTVLPPGAPYAYFPGGWVGVPATHPPELERLGAFPDLEDPMTVECLHELLYSRVPRGLWATSGTRRQSGWQPGGLERVEVTLRLSYRHTEREVLGESKGEVAALMALRLGRWQ